MKKIIFSLTTQFFLITFSASAQQNFSGILETSKNLKFKDPFVSFLPKKEKPVPSTQDIKSIITVKEKERNVVLPPLTITGVVWNTDTPQAIINHQVVSIGDTIDNIKITAIAKAGIKVTYLGVSFILKPEWDFKPEKMTDPLPNESKT